MKNIMLRALLLGLIILFSASCSGGGGGDGDGGHKPTIESINITPDNPSITSDKTQQFTATATYSDNTTKDITSSVTWSSSQTGVATISNEGIVTTISVGSTTIIATLASVSGNTTLTVSTTVSALYSGTWHSQTVLDTTNCGADIADTLDEYLVVTQSGDAVTVNKGAYTFTGATNDNDGFDVHGPGPVPVNTSGCIGARAYSFNAASNGNAIVVVAVGCVGTWTCTATYRGTAVLSE